MNNKIQTPYGKTKLYEAHPTVSSGRHLETEKNEGSVLVVPGYSETLAHTRKLVDALSLEGFDAITFSQPRKRNKAASGEDVIDRQAEIILEVLRNKEQEPTNVVAHSLGSAAVLRAAQKDPERFQSITLMQPVGMDGGQTFPEQLKRTMGKKVPRNTARSLRSQNSSKINYQPRHSNGIVNEEYTPKHARPITIDEDFDYSLNEGYTPKHAESPLIGEYAARVDEESALSHSSRVAKAQMVGGAVLARQPVLAYGEARAAGGYDIKDDLEAVSDLGIKVNVVTANSDEMFDQEKMDSGYRNIADRVDSYSTVADTEAGHDTFWMQPERTAGIVKQLLVH